MMLDGSETALLVREGHSVHPTRQEMPHTHYIAPMPGGTHLAVCDLGTDSIAVYDRGRAVMTGVCDVDNFNENEINMMTAQGYLTLRGSDLHIRRLDPERGEVEVEGTVLGMAYAEPVQRPAGGFLSRLFG